MTDVIPKADISSALIQLAKRDDVDPAKLEHLLKLQEKMEDRQNQRELSKALSLFQSECPIVKKTKKTNNATYAPLDELVYTIKPYLKKHGLSYTFSIQTKDDDNNEITVTIRHASGASLDSTYTFPRLDDGGRMNSSQRVKSANTYAKRTALENALGIVTADIDDDASRAVDTPASEEQIREIARLIESTNSKEEDVLKFLKIKAFDELSDFEAKKAIRALRTKRAK